MKTWIGAWLLLTVGCGSTTPAPETANDANEERLAEETAAESIDAEKETPASGEAETSESPPTADEADSAPLSTEDLNEVLQAMLDDPALDQHLKTDKPGRAPVKLSGSDLPDDLKVIKGGYPIKIVDEPQSEKEPVLMLTRIDRTGNIVTIRYRYAVEGIRGTSKIKKGSSGWELMSSRIMQ